VVIVDNGARGCGIRAARGTLLASDAALCLNACPVFREIGGHAYVASDGAPAPYPGPIGSIVSPGLGRAGAVRTSCPSIIPVRRMQGRLPVEIDLPTLLIRVRGGEPEKDTTDGGTGLSGLDANRAEGLCVDRGLSGDIRIRAETGRPCRPDPVTAVRNGCLSRIHGLGNEQRRAQASHEAFQESLGRPSPLAVV